jgi:photosystem II stability/assembly factor-like uncharacterized protein
MSEDRIRAVFTEPVTPLNPPPGTWERIEREAARRRRGRRLTAVGSVAAAVALFAGGAVWAGAALDRDGSLEPSPPGPSQTVPAPQPSTTTSVTRKPTESPSTPADVALPKGGPVPAGFVAVSVTTTPDGYLYALGTAPCSKAPCTSVVRSHDDGRTWVGIPAPKAELADGITGATLDPGEVGDLGQVTEIRFATARDGWAFGGALWETHDGGGTWTKVHGVKGRVLDLVVDGDRVMGLATACLTDKCPLGTQLIYAGVRGGAFTADVGLTRKPISRARFSSGSGAIVLVLGTQSDPASDFYFVKDGDPLDFTAPCPADGSTGGFLSVTPPATGGRGLVAFCGDPGAGNLQVTVRRSTDGGRSWSTVGSGLRLSNGVFSGTALTLDKLVAASGNPDLNGSMNRSSDGGKNWSVTSEPAPDGGWRWVAAAGGGKVLALPLTAGAVYLSTDGGESFTARPIH